MAWIETFEENEARGLLGWVYRVARWSRGRVPNIVKVSSLNPRGSWLLWVPYSAR
jgi:hypothetical protein